MKIYFGIVIKALKYWVRSVLTNTEFKWEEIHEVLLLGAKSPSNYFIRANLCFPVVVDLIAIKANINTLGQGNPVDSVNCQFQFLKRYFSFQPSQKIEDDGSNANV